MGRVVKRLLFLMPAFAPLALSLCAFDAQPLPLAQAICMQDIPRDIPQIPYDMLKICSRYAQDMPKI